MFNKKTIEDIDVRNKRVLVRVDYNVPLDENLNITDDTRIRLSLPTINYLIKNEAKIILMSHLGRPKGVPEDKYRLDPVAKRLGELIGKEVKKFDEIYSDEIKDYIDNKMSYGEIVMLENLRFDPREKANDSEFSKLLASLADVYVNDAFGAAHRAHASVEGITHYLPAVAGFLMKKEVEVLTSLLESPKRPFLTILGGAKVSDKIKVIENLLGKVDSLILGGGMSYTFLKARGYGVGKSICEDDQIDFAKDMLELARKNNVNLLLPVDIVVAKEFDSEADKKMVSIQSIPEGWMGMDIGDRSIELFKEEISYANTIFWNGPLGVFEWDNFSKGTKSIATAIAESGAVAVAGGGDTIAALKKYNLFSKFTHVSSGGGASMELLEGKELPGIASLMDK
ncbi:MAG: phosphoglycerate kinase [Candidatus Humimicrobiaceae bacterium]|jgi:3-phosphoglycerate kinase|nr:phosphoglycerate kinase [Candidatus Humimicrobiaceae bacterium]